MCTNISAGKCDARALGPRKVIGRSEQELMFVYLTITPTDASSSVNPVSCINIKIYSKDSRHCTTTRNWRPVASITPSPKVIRTHAICIGSDSLVEANQYSKRNTADVKGVYVSEFINGGVFDETCG